MCKQLCVLFLSNTVEYLMETLNYMSVFFPPGWRYLGSPHIETDIQSRAVSQREWLLLAGWRYRGAPWPLQRSDASRCHWLSPHRSSSLRPPIFPLTAQIARHRCDGKLQLCSAQFRGSGYAEPPVRAQTDSAVAKLWCGAMLRSTPQVRICGITVISHETYVHSHPLFGNWCTM